MVQIKKVRVLVDEAIANGNQRLKEIEADRAKNLSQIGNILHESVPVSNDEVCNIFRNIIRHQLSKSNIHHRSYCHMSIGRRHT